jgi:hypothetical protein
LRVKDAKLNRFGEDGRRKPRHFPRWLGEPVFVREKVPL